MPKLPGAQRSSDTNLKVTVFWGDILYDTAVCGPGDEITVGRKPGNTFILDLERPQGIERDSLRIVNVNPDNTADLYFTDYVSGHFRLGSDLVSFRAAIDAKKVARDSEGHYHVRLSKSDKADFVIGHVSFYLDWIGKAAKIPPAPLLTRKRAIFGGAMLASFLLVVALMHWLASDIEDKPPERLVTILPPKNAPAKAAMGERKSEDGGAQKGEAGKADTAAPEKPSAAQTLKNANLGSLVSGITSLGAKAPTVDSKPTAAAAVSQQGTGGFSTEGLKTGGGGQTVGIGRQVGKGEGGFEGTGRLGLSGNSAVEGGTGYGDGASTEGGGLDRDVIESIIRRRLDRIRLCYERQLNFYPKLAGKVSVHFVIGKQGEVLTSAINDDTMKNKAVTSCILAEVKSWTFPQPEGGTLVKVDYPFVFESSAKAAN